MRSWLRSLALVLSSTVIAASAPPVRLALLPRVGLAGQGLRVTVTIEPNTDNREWCLTVDNGESFTATSCEDKPWTFPRDRKFQFNDLPAGHYVVQFQLAQADRKLITVRDEVCFRGMEESCGDE